MRRQFQLGEEDEECLNARGSAWETVREGETKWLILPSYTIPAGYNYTMASAALRIKPSYPDDDIDMVYFFPPLALTSGKAIGGLSSTQIDGKPYQQWSRHRTPQNPWRPGIDNVGTHLVLVEELLRREPGG